METSQYRNFPKEVAAKILPKWKEYRELFGFEADIAKKLESEGLSSSDIEKALLDRRQLIDGLWNK